VFKTYRKKPRIQVAILTIFLFLSIIQSISILSFTFYKNKQSHYAQSLDVLTRVSHFLEVIVENHLAPAQKSVSLSKKLLKNQTILNIESKSKVTEFFAESLLMYPQITSFLIGDKEGNFFQIYRALQQPHSFKNQPKDTYFVVQIINNKEASVLFLSKEFKFLAYGKPNEELQNYVPSNRIWYQQALEKKDITWTNLYQYANGDNGVTVATPLKDSLDTIVAADVTTGSLSELLTIDKSSEEIDRIIVVNRKNEIIADSNYGDTNKEKRELLEEALKNSVKQENEEALFTFNSKRFFIIFQPMSEEFAQNWYIGIISTTDSFIGSLVSTNKKILATSLVITILAALIIYLLSKKISTPIRNLAKDMNQVEKFEIDLENRVQSFFYEIWLMDNALSSMKKALKSFSCYVPLNLVKQLILKGEDAVIGGKQKEISIMFTDIKDFTTISEKIEHKVLMQHISSYCQTMVPIIQENDGVIDKYIGDAIMAFWGAPKNDKQHSYHACLSALACKKALDSFNDELKKKKLPIFYTRIGLHTGPALVGNIGTSERMNYTVIGDTVNLTSRLEGLNKEYGSQIIVSEDMYKKMRNIFLFRPLGEVSVRGREQKTQVFELLETIKEASESLHLLSTLSQEAYETMKGGNREKGRVLYKDILEKFPDDLPTQYILKKEFNTN
jgi:adenylate cyclase